MAQRRVMKAAGGVDRDDLMQRLIHDQLEKLDTGKCSHRLMRVLEDALQEFAEMSDEELSQELARRGLMAEFDYPVEPMDEPDDAEADEDEDDYDVRSLRGSARHDDWASVPG